MRPYLTLAIVLLAIGISSNVRAQGGSLSGKLKFSVNTVWSHDCAEREQLVGRRGQLLTDQLYTTPSADAGADAKFEAVPVFDDQPEAVITEVSCADRDGQRVLRISLRIEIGSDEGKTGFVEVQNLIELNRLFAPRDALKALR